MKYHVLPGDALVETFNQTEIDGDVIVCRECLIDGEIKAANLEDFWKMRAAFIGENYGAEETDYLNNVAAEFQKLRNLPEDSEVNLWFEYELFCQVNMWFCLSLLQDKNVKIFRVAPIVKDEKDVWKGFGKLETEDLEKCFADRIEFSETDVQIGVKLWKAFQDKNWDELKTLGAEKSDSFPKLAEVCAAAIEIENRPAETLRKIISDETTFENIFAQFSASEGVYGFGDAQVKRILQKI